MNLHVCANDCVSWVLRAWWLEEAYQNRADEISIGNEGEDVTNNFHRKSQQRELSAHLHRFARGKWEEVDGAEMGRLCGDREQTGFTL